MQLNTLGLSKKTLIDLDELLLIPAVDPPAVDGDRQPLLGLGILDEGVLK